MRDALHPADSVLQERGTKPIGGVGARGPSSRGPRAQRRTPGFLREHEADLVVKQRGDVAEGVTGYEEWLRGAHVTADGAALKARRIVSAMLAEEAGRSTLRPGYSR